MTPLLDKRGVTKFIKCFVCPQRFKKGERTASADGAVEFVLEFRFSSKLLLILVQLVNWLL